MNIYLQRELDEEATTEESSVVQWEGKKLLIHDPGKFAYLDAAGPGGAIFELMQRR